MWILATQLQSIKKIHHIHNDAHMVKSLLACGKNIQSNWDGPDVELEDVAHCLLWIKTKGAHQFLANIFWLIISSSFVLVNFIS